MSRNYVVHAHGQERDICPFGSHCSSRKVTTISGEKSKLGNQSQNLWRNISWFLPRKHWKALRVRPAETRYGDLHVTIQETYEAKAIADHPTPHYTFSHHLVPCIILHFAPFKTTVNSVNVNTKILVVIKNEFVIFMFSTSTPIMQFSIISTISLSP
jgi:hypothetical protein